MKIGWIGTGVMGSSMAGHILGENHDLYVYNRTRGKAEGLLNRGAHWCDSPFEVAKSSEIVFTIVGFPKDVDEVYRGDQGLINAGGSCQIMVDMTTSNPSLAQAIATESAEIGVECLDAPVSGGDVGAKEATLAIMVGGKRETYDRVLPLFQCMGKTISYMGGPGAGQHTKMCNQILIAGTMIGVVESLIYAEKLGLDRQSVIDIIGKDPPEN